LDPLCNCIFSSSCFRRFARDSLRPLFVTIMCTTIIPLSVCVLGAKTRLAILSLFPVLSQVTAVMFVCTILPAIMLLVTIVYFTLNILWRGNPRSKRMAEIRNCIVSTARLPDRLLRPAVSGSILRFPHTLGKPQGPERSPIL